MRAFYATSGTIKRYLIPCRGQPSRARSSAFAQADRLVCAHWSRRFRPERFRRIGLVVHVAAAEERNAIEDVFLDPFQRQINNWRDIESNELRDDESANDNQSEWPAR